MTHGPTRRTIGEGDQLAALAADYGIEAEFVDARGERRQTSPETRRALLRAMGVPTDGPADVRHAHEAFADRAWERVLPPVLVTASPVVDVELTLPDGTGEISWRIGLEGGAQRTGTVPFVALPLCDTRQRGDASWERRRLRLPETLPAGYHQLTITAAVVGGTTMSLIVTPETCWLPPAIVAGGRISGIAVQLYLLRSATNWGIGDFGDLRALVELVAARGGDVVGLNPLHALFVDDPEHASPYSPQSRLLLNVLNIDVPAIPEFATSQAARALLETGEFGRQLAACQAAPLVRYAAVAELKIAVLRLLFADFMRQAPDQRRDAFEEFRAAGSATRERAFLFSALREWFAARAKRPAPPRQWPPTYRDAASPAVAAFAREHTDAVTFFAWLEWIADSQLAAAAAAAQPMRIGLYRDLAVGADPGGAETWCSRATVAGARIGAPPDIDNPAGQNWDLPPFDPHALRDEGYASFIELVRANMRHAGALRIDHVMALQHAYWIAQGGTPSDGAYVRYPLDDLVGIIALESQRARCMVVGEDLGTVPEGFRERMERAGILSYRVLLFERGEHGAFIEPQDYPRAAVGIFGNHDLATLAAWWTGADISLRERLALAAPGPEQARRRAAERAAFVAALAADGLLATDAARDPDAPFSATHAFLARSACALVIAQLDDIAGEVDPVNVPTTTDQYPNWRRRVSVRLEDLAVTARWTELFAVLASAGRLREGEESLLPGSGRAAPNRAALPSGARRAGRRSAT